MFRAGLDPPDRNLGHQAKKQESKKPVLLAVLRMWKAKATTPARRKTENKMGLQTLSTFNHTPGIEICTSTIMLVKAKEKRWYQTLTQKKSICLRWVPLGLRKPQRGSRPAWFPYNRCRKHGRPHEPEVKGRHGTCGSMLDCDLLVHGETRKIQTMLAISRKGKTLSLSPK